MEDFLQTAPEAFGDSGPALIALAIVTLYVWTNKDVLLESYMSRRRKKAWHKAQREIIADVISRKSVV